jgi:thiamine-phosphate pyrophosphorylase
MTLSLPKPILYLITRGATVEETISASEDFKSILAQVSLAVAAGIELIQLREKKLTARVLFELAQRTVAIARGSSTRVLVNDRADIAAAAGADGVHLATRSLGAATVRRTFGDNFLIGVSAHSPAEATAARGDGADFVVLGPVFETASKIQYGAPLGIDVLAQVSSHLRPFPILALGGVSEENARRCLRQGASGVAGISLFADPSKLKEIVPQIRDALIVPNQR